MRSKLGRKLNEDVGMKFYKILLTILIILPFFAEGFEYLITYKNPMRGSEEAVREKLLKLTALGENANEVHKTLKNQRFFDLTELVPCSLCVVDDLHPALYPEDKEAKCNYVGKSYIRGAEIFDIFFTYNTYAYWVFDENQKLIEIYVINTHWIGEIQ